MTARAARALRAGLAIAVLLACVPGAAAATPSPPNTVSRWDEIAQNTVVSSGAFQNEGLVYMAYVSAAVYDAATSIQGDYEPYGHRIPAPRGASKDAAVIEAAYQTLVNYSPPRARRARQTSTRVTARRWRRSPRDRPRTTGSRSERPPLRRSSRFVPTTAA